MKDMGKERAEATKYCIRCRSNKPVKGFKENKKDIYSVRGAVCEDCRKTDYEVAECEPGDQVKYIASKKKDGSIYFDDTCKLEFVSLIDQRYCLVKIIGTDAEGVKCYIPHLRRI